MHLIFFFPYKNISGVPVLFSTLAEYIATNYLDIHVSIVDYEDGVISKLIKNERINRIVFNDGVKVNIPEDGILILQSILPFSVRPEMQITDEQKMFFWNLHPNCLILNNITKINKIDKFINSLRVGTKLKLKKFIQICLHHNSLVFMDDSNSTNTFAYYGINEFPFFLQICGKSIPDSQNFRTEFDLQNLKFSYIGRIVDFKFYPLKRTLIALNNLARENKISKKITFHIIGEGDKLDRLKDFVLKSINYIEVCFEGVLNNDRIQDFLLDKKININFAMGTSVLDSLQIGIPTILLNYSYEELLSYPKYYFAHEEKFYSLGRELQPDDMNPENLNSLLSAINEYIEAPKKYSDESIAYYRQFSVKTVSGKLINYLNKSSLKYDEVKPFFTKSLIRKIYNWRKYKLG